MRDVFVSDCFSNAILITQSKRPDSIKWPPKSAVCAPTLPAVCIRIMGLPAPPTASARKSSGIMTPSN